MIQPAPFYKMRAGNRSASMLGAARIDAPNSHRRGRHSNDVRALTAKPAATKMGRA